MKLRGRAAIITGASLGLGEAIAEAFVKEGADLIICARNTEALDKTADRLRSVANSDQKIAVCTADVGNEAQVDRLFELVAEEFSGLDIVVNNAGVYGPMGSIENVDWSEWTDAVRINLFGTVYVCRKAVPMMRARGYGKIINISGGGATTPLPGISSYAAAKAGVVRFTETLAHEVKDAGIDVNAVAPGALKTRLLRQVLDAGTEALGEEFITKMETISAQGGTPLSVGANLCVYLASAASDGISGRLIAAQWDPWEKLAEHREALESSDIYTLRRIIPSDRGQPWGER